MPFVFFLLILLGIIQTNASRVGYLFIDFQLFANEKTQAYTKHMNKMCTYKYIIS